jgi:fatty acid desaturase
MHVLKDLSMAVRSIGILYLFYLQFMNAVDIPLSVVVMIAFGSLGAAFWCQDDEKHKHYFGRKLLNYGVGFIGVALILKQYM